MAVQGYITDPESSEPVIGAEFNADRNVAEVYIDEGACMTEIALTYEQVRQLAKVLASVESAMERHMATWVYTKSWNSGSSYHLQKKGEHDPRKQAICGCQPPEHWKDERHWDLSPVLKEPWRTGSVCKRCLAIYDKQMKENA